MAHCSRIHKIYKRIEWALRELITIENIGIGSIDRKASLN